MAGTVKEMSLIKQVLQLKQREESNRGIARQLPINKETVNGCMQTPSMPRWYWMTYFPIDSYEKSY